MEVESHDADRASRRESRARVRVPAAGVEVSPHRDQGRGVTGRLAALRPNRSGVVIADQRRDGVMQK